MDGDYWMWVYFEVDFWCDVGGIGYEVVVYVEVGLFVEFVCF